LLLAVRGRRLGHRLGLAQAVTLPRETSLDGPRENAWGLRGQPLDELPILRVLRDRHGKGDEPDAPPNCMVGAANLGSMVG
jgi:hypothetical protein